VDENPIFGVSVDDYRRVLRAASALSPEDSGVAEAVAKLEIDPKKWKFAAPKWAARFAESKTPVFAESTRTQPLETQSTPRGPYVEPSLDLEAFIDMWVRLQYGETKAEVAARHGLAGEAGFEQATSEWMAAFEHRPRLQRRYILIVQRAATIREGDLRANARRKPKALATRVRARRCPWCGAHKRTAHDRPWIHCDCCGALFDYDIDALTPAQSELESIARGSLQMVLDAEELPSGAEERRRALEEGQRWIHEVLSEVTPWAYPARIADPEYRARYIGDYLVPAERTLRESDEFQKHHAKLVLAGRALTSQRPTFAQLEPVLRVQIAHFDLQVKLLEQAQLFAKHPDRMSAELYRRARLSLFTSIWIQEMKPAEGQKLLEATGMKSEWIEPPAVALANAGCGRCASPLVIVASATRVVCESCGCVANAETVFSCRACGGAMIAVEGELPSRCGQCGVHWEAV